MIYEHHFERQTNGLVCGPSLLTSEHQLVQTLAFNRQRWSLRNVAPLPWAPVTVHYKVIVRAREGGEVLWARPFGSKLEAVITFCRLARIDINYTPGKFIVPSAYIDGELEYQFATVTTYNSTTNNSGADWSAGGTRCPTGVTAADYLVIAGGGGGGYDGGGGGGAGGYLTGTADAVTASTNYPVTVGAGGAGGTSGAVQGGDGSATSWNSHAPTGGGGGGGSGTPNGRPGGSGGGARYNGSNTGGSSTVGQGHDGGSSASGNGAGGGGGASAAGAAGTGSLTGGKGGDGLASSITGSSVTRAGGGGGVVGALGGAGGGGQTNSGAPGSPGTANTGGGGGGGDGSGTRAGGAGGSGVVILSWSPNVIGGLWIIM